MHLEIYAYINIPKSGHVHKPYTHAFLRQCIYIKFLIFTFTPMQNRNGTVTHRYIFLLSEL